MAIGDPKRCGKCGYDLTGLPGVGACPECGELFNRFTGKGVTTPGTQAQETERLMRRVKIFAGLALAVFCVVCSGVIQKIFPNGRAFAMGSVFAIVPVLWAVANYVDDKSSK